MTAGRCLSPVSSEKINLTRTTSPRLYPVISGILVIIPDFGKNRVSFCRQLQKHLYICNLFSRTGHLIYVFFAKPAMTFLANAERRQPAFLGQFVDSSSRYTQVFSSLLNCKPFFSDYHE